ncbi:LuxR C-terminal-related transcriptional regulator [Paraburkholderia sp. BL25I1N1]|uniref:helix-turn-helix transcriptional regulator n=1 Tax=Paraburkholderia sp. BL25I1N1 TaxID=1938804 RepID=UPI000D06D8AE|nr:LuxR C-terminal-related transcriptional regulator [Paraburkholderia sp. BL25I1N1]PRY04545.1 LuxR family transcriptional regulator [Paraburkholderia sp. BL25I1N1]
MTQPHICLLTRFSSFLNELNQASHDIDASVFRYRAFDLLNELVPFDSGWWGMYAHSGSGEHIAQAALHNLPDSFLAEYANLVSEDPICDLLRQHVGTTFSFAGDLSANAERLNAFDRKYGLHAALSTCMLDSESGIFLFYSLFRNPGAPPFSEQERQLIELATPHLILAWSRNRTFNQIRRQLHSTLMIATIDEHGLLIEAAPGLIQYIYKEFPDWDGRTLPSVIRHCISIEGCAAYFRGKYICAKRETDSGRMVLALMPPASQASVLTPREQAVASAFSAGKSYKEVAIDLAISPSTVRSYLQQCYSKLNVRNKVELHLALQMQRL